MSQTLPRRSKLECMSCTFELGLAIVFSITGWHLLLKVGGVACIRVQEPQ
jgi:hypothetical protein